MDREGGREGGVREGERNGSGSGREVMICFESSSESLTFTGRSGGLDDVWGSTPGPTSDSMVLRLCSCSARVFSLGVGNGLF